MKKDTHPKHHPVVFVDTGCGVEFITVSTMTSEKTRAIDGVDHFVIPIEISSASHPFYTGKQTLVDTSRRVEKFQERVTRSHATAGTRKGKRAKRSAVRAKKAAEGPTPVEEKKKVPSKKSKKKTAAPSPSAQ